MEEKRSAVHTLKEGSNRNTEAELDCENWLKKSCKVQLEAAARKRNDSMTLLTVVTM